MKTFKYFCWKYVIAIKVNLNYLVRFKKFPTK